MKIGGIGKYPFIAASAEKVDFGQVARALCRERPEHASAQPHAHFHGSRAPAHAHRRTRPALACARWPLLPLSFSEPLPRGNSQ
eukprot:6182999-Pleurochrysis_carterae.AAC.1